MISPSTRLAIAFGMLAGAIFTATYSWCFTPLGRLDYRAALLSKIASWQEGDVDMTPSGRAKANRVTASLLASYSVDPSVSIEDRMIATFDGAEIPIRIYTPPGPGPHPFYLDLHGGGWWMGDGFLATDAMGRFAAQTGAIVVSVDYRLAPEHPYPIPLDDCDAALSFIADRGASIGGDPSRIAIGGSSAGGNLSAALALRSRDRGFPRISFQYLEVPATDLSGTRGWFSYDDAGDGYGLTVAAIESMIDAYVPDLETRYEPYVSPLLEGDLAGLPPAFVVTAHFDPLRDQGEAYASRLQKARVPVVLHREPGAIHGFLGSPERARKIQSMAARAVHAALFR